jgi:hypothetical protein
VKDKTIKNQFFACFTVQSVQQTTYKHPERYQKLKNVEFIDFCSMVNQHFSPPSQTINSKVIFIESFVDLRQPLQKVNA